MYHILLLNKFYIINASTTCSFSETEKIWNTYQEQRSLILITIRKTMRELEKPVAKTTNGKQVDSELKSKLELKAELQKVININLQKLKDLSAFIVKITGPEHQTVITKEVSKPFRIWVAIK